MLPVGEVCTNCWTLAQPDWMSDEVAEDLQVAIALMMISRTEDDGR